MPNNSRKNVHSDKNVKKAPRALDEQAVNAVNEAHENSSDDKESVNTKPRKPQYVRRFGLSTYIPVQELDRYLRHLPWLQHWAYCHHDKDVESDGTPKVPHTHVILYTYSAKTSSAIKKNFDNYAEELARLSGELKENTLVEVCNDAHMLYRYLTHKDDPDKYQYPDTDVVVDDIDYWAKLCYTDGMTDSSNNKGLAMFQDIIQGTTTLEMIQRYGKEYIYHIGSFKQAVSDYSRENYLANMDFKSQLPTFYEVSQLVLHGSIFSEEQVNIYFNLLSYVQSALID